MVFIYELSNVCSLKSWIYLQHNTGFFCSNLLLRADLGRHRRPTEPGICWILRRFKKTGLVERKGKSDFWSTCSYLMRPTFTSLKQKENCKFCEPENSHQCHKKPLQPVKITLLLADDVIGPSRHNIWLFESDWRWRFLVSTRCRNSWNFSPNNLRPRSYDWTPLNYCLGGFLKNTVDVTSPQTIQDLKCTFW